MSHTMWVDRYWDEIVPKHCLPWKWRSGDCTNFTPRQRTGEYVTADISVVGVNSFTRDERVHNGISDTRGSVTMGLPQVTI